MESLYFIAIVPPAEIQDGITKLKLEVAKKYGSKHALNSPPHITLHMPFKWKEKRLNQLAEVRQELNSCLVPFSVELKDFDFFEPRVLFVDVVRNDDLDVLQSKVVQICRQKLNLQNAYYKDQPFHPHVTIGFRDLKKTMFYAARQEFENRKVSYGFLVSKVELLKHDGKRWCLFDKH